MVSALAPWRQFMVGPSRQRPHRSDTYFISQLDQHTFALHRHLVLAHCGGLSSRLHAAACGHAASSTA